MFYLLALLLIAIIFYVLTHVVSALLKGCLTTVGLVALGVLIFLFFKSTRQPVSIFDYYVIDNFNVERVQK